MGGKKSYHQYDATQAYQYTRQTGLNGIKTTLQ
jgi:hypothetical protein